MSLPSPNLDDRTFDDILDEAKKLIQTKCPQWTDFNPSDPGITLVELMAWMTEMIIYRTNQVPEKNYIKFLELMGISLKPQQPSFTWIVFRVAKRAQQKDLKKVPMGAKVATGKIDGEKIEFETTCDLNLSCAQILKICSKSVDEQHKEIVNEIYSGSDETSLTPGTIPVSFGEKSKILWVSTDQKQSEHHLFIGFDSQQLSPVLLRFRQKQVSMPNTLNWQYSSKSRWLNTRPISDGTQGFTQTGIIEFDTLNGWSQLSEFSTEAFWLRAKIEIADINFIPELIGMHLNSTQAIQASSTRNEIIGSSTGEQYQSFKFNNSPLLPNPEIIIKEIDRPTEKQISKMKKLLGKDVIEDDKSNGLWVKWHEVNNFFESTSTDRHFTIDLNNGTISFGNGVNGKIPPPGRKNIKAAVYWTGGGATGNIGSGAITKLETPVPFVTAVTNPDPAGGGSDIESIETAKLRAPWTLKHRNRAVTLNDFKYLAKEASGEVAKVHCFTDSGKIQVVIIPQNSSDPNSKKLKPSPMLLKKVKDYLDKRRLITTRLEVSSPMYKPVWKEVAIVLLPEKKNMVLEIEKELHQAIENLYHPLTGGPENKGWPMGRAIHISEIYYTLEQISGVDYVDSVILKDSKHGQAKNRISMKDENNRPLYPYLEDLIIVTSVFKG